MGFNHSINDAMKLAAEKIGIPEWQAYRWTLANGGSIVDGCVPDGVYAHGPRKGRPRFSKPKNGTKQAVIVSDSELDQKAAAFEQSERKCWNCKGEGQVCCGWSKESGARYRQCNRCNGTGIAPAPRGGVGE